MRLAATTPPTPTRPAWPRLTVPLQPVSTTSDRAAIPRISVALTRLVWLGLATSGTRTATPATAAANAARQRRTSGSAATAAGSGRATPARDHEDSSAASARLRSRRRISSATRMTAQKTTVVTACWEVFQRTIWSKTPSAIPAPNAAGSDPMPATTAAASAGSSTAGPAAASIVRP